jgi:tetratricopeptide (TPR) repeat protein
MWTVKGRAMSCKGDYDRAIADYTEAIRLDPGLALAYNNRGFAYSHKGDNDRAIADYDQAINVSVSYGLHGRLQSGWSQPHSARAPVAIHFPMGS